MAARTDLLALLEVIVQSLTDYDDWIQIASLSSLQHRLHRELVGAGFDPNFIANWRLVSPSRRCGVL